MAWSGQQQINTYQIAEAAACACGATLPLTGAHRFNPEDDPVVQQFRAAHTGPDCGPCDSQEAAQARRRKRRAGERAAVA